MHARSLFLLYYATCDSTSRPPKARRGGSAGWVRFRIRYRTFILISVALCTHNGARFLGEQIRSICLQTLRPGELILSDDASSDDSVAVARAALRDCAGVVGSAIEFRVLENRQALRVTKNFEQAAMACRGDLIALSDQDDVWHPERLARMAAEFERRPELTLLHTDARLVDDKGQALGQTLFQALEVQAFELGQIHQGMAFDMLMRRNLVTGATTVFRRELLAQAVPFPAEWLHDEWLGAIAAALGRVDVLEQCLIDYRQHALNEVGARRNTLAQNVRKAFEPRGTKHDERARRAELLLERLVQLDGVVSPGTVDVARGKVDHQRFRAGLPSRHIGRVPPIVREALRGRYDRFGRGWRAVVSDLLESA